MSDQYVPFPIVPPMPASEKHWTQPGDTWSTLSPEQQTNVAQEQALTQQRLEDISGPERKLADQQSAIHAEAAAARAAGMEQQAQERQQRDQETAADLALYKNRLEGAYKNAQSAPAASLFADGTTGEKVMRGVGLAMAGLGDAIRDAGAARQGRGPGPSTFLNLIEMDLQRQREHIAKLKDEVLMARTGVQDAAKAREVALAEVDAKGAGFLKRIEGWMNARMDALKDTPLAKDVNQAANMAAAKQAGLDYQQRSFAGLERKHAGPTTETITRDAKPDAAGKDPKDIVMGDPLNPAEAGKPLGEVTSGRGGAQAFSQTDTGLTTAVDALKALHKDIVDHGERPTSLADVKRRNALNANATLQVGAVSTAGQSDQALSTEAGTIGVTHSPTTQWLMGANPDAIAAKIHELENRKVRARGQGLLPLTPGQDASMGSRGAPVGPVAPLVPKLPGANQAIPPATPSSGAPQSPREQIIRMLRANPDRKGRRVQMQQYHITDEDLR